MLLLLLCERSAPKRSSSILLRRVLSAIDRIRRHRLIRTTQEKGLCVHSSVVIIAIENLTISIKCGVKSSVKMILFTNIFNYRLCRRQAKINQQRSSSYSYSASANSGLLLAFTFLLLIIVGCLPSSTNGFRILGRDTGKNE